MSSPCSAKTLLFLPMLALCALATGCADCKGKMRPLNVSIALDDQMRDATGRVQRVEVDLVGVNVTSLPEWEAKPMSEYFTRSDPLRNSAQKYTIQLDASKKSEKFSIENPLWATWQKQGVLSLVVLSSHPRGVQDVPGNVDPRRRIVSLDCADIKDEAATEIEVVVKPGGLAVTTPHRPER